MNSGMRCALVGVVAVLAVLVAMSGMCSEGASPPSPEAAREVLPKGQPMVVDSPGEPRTEVTAADPTPAGPGLAGVVEFSDGRPGEVALRICRNGETVATVDRVPVPGNLKVPSWASSPELVQAVFSSDRACGAFWCRHGDAGRKFVLDVAPMGGVTWIVPAAFGTPVLAATFYPVVDFAGEDKDVSVESHWTSVAMAGGMRVAALIDVDARPNVSAEGVARYTVDCVPCGDYVCMLRHRNPLGIDAVWGQRILVTAPVTDLGSVALCAERRELRVVDAATALPIAACARLAVGPWRTDYLVAADAAGVVRLPALATVAWVLTSPGYVTKRVCAAELGADVRLERATAHALRGEAGTMWLALEGGQWIAALCGADGAAELHTRAEDLATLEVVRYAPATGTYDVTKGRVDPAAAVSCRLVVACDDGPLAAGSASLTWKDGPFVTTVSIRDGVGVARVPRGAYQIAVRVGPQVHDNDHEYYFARSVGEGADNMRFQLPGGRLRLTVLDAQNYPVDGQWLTVASRGSDDQRACSWRIRSSGRVRNGAIEFTALPEARLSVLVGKREIASLPGPCTMTLNLQ